MKRTLTFLLIFIMVFTMSACGSKPEETQEPGTAPEAAAPDNATDAPEQTAPENSGDSSAQETVPKTEKELYAERISRPWALYSPTCHTEVFWLDLKEDGTYTARLDHETVLAGWVTGNDACYEYSGTWELKESEAVLPYMLTLNLTETDDEMLQGLDSLGDFTFEVATYVDGKEVVYFRQLNNGEGLQSVWFYNIEGNYLYADCAMDSSLKVYKNTQFTGQVWKLEYEPEFVLYVDEVKVDADGFIVNDEPGCDPVRVNTSGAADENVSMLSGGAPGFYTMADCAYLFTTDEDGQIISAEYIPTGPALSFEDAVRVLSDYDEINLTYGGDAAFMDEGTGPLEYQYVRFVAVGTDHDDQFVRERQYAVTIWGDVMSYNAVDDEWVYISPFG